MKLGIGLIILSITFVDSSQHTNDTIIRIEDGANSSSKNTSHKELTEKTDQAIDVIQHQNYTMVKKKSHDTNISTSGERRWITFFPKNNQKILVTMKSIQRRNNSTPIIQRTRKTPVYKILSRVVNNNRKENYWKRITTRRPLMKFTKFTLSPTTTLKITTNSRNIEREAAKKYKSYVFNKMMGASKKDDSSEERTFNIDAKNNYEKAKNVNTVTSAFQKIRSRMNNEIKKLENVSKLKEANSKLHTSEFSSEEREDKEEFIFIRPKKIKENAVKVIKDSSESDEMTTLVYEHEKKRLKRSSNVIEEENLGTTVSGFKFTGKVTSLGSDLIFRNINT